MLLELWRLFGEQNGDEYPDENLEQIVGATYEGKEGVINQLVYRE